jgi:hypothetical protein
MVEVLQLAVANIREFVALQEAGELHAYGLSCDDRPPQLGELQSIVDRVEAVLSNYEMGLPRRG